MPGSCPIAPLFAASEATGLPLLDSEAFAMPLPLNPAVPLPLAERCPLEVEAPLIVVVPFMLPIVAVEWFAADEPAVPAPMTPPVAVLFEATPIGPEPIGDVALPLAALVPCESNDATA